MSHDSWEETYSIILPHHKVTVSYLLFTASAESGCKYAWRFPILIVTHYSQTHKRASRPRPKEGAAGLQIVNVNCRPHPYYLAKARAGGCRLLWEGRWRASLPLPEAFPDSSAC